MLLGILNAQASGGGGLPPAYWLSLIGGASDDKGEGIAIDSEGNVYSCGFTTSVGAGSFDAVLIKYD